VNRLTDAIHVLVGRAEAVFDDELQLVERFVTTEEKRVETMITDALNALAAAKDAVLAKIANDAAALSQAQADRDTAQAALADAENQINAVASQLNGAQPNG
jgi:hypothetical protein